MLLQTLLMMKFLLFIIRRWRLPFGALSLIIILNISLVTITRDEYRLIPTAVVAGLVGDGLLWWLKPSAERIATNGDEQILTIARRKIAKDGVKIQLDHGMAYALPYPDASFDRVVSSLVIHHLTPDNKQRTFQEAFRILKPEGELHVLDFGPTLNNGSAHHCGSNCGRWPDPFALRKSQSRGLPAP